MESLNSYTPLRETEGGGLFGNERGKIEKIAVAGTAECVRVSVSLRSQTFRSSFEVALMVKGTPAELAGLHVEPVLEPRGAGKVGWGGGVR